MHRLHQPKKKKNCASCSQCSASPLFIVSKLQFVPSILTGCGYPGIRATNIFGDPPNSVPALAMDVRISQTRTKLLMASAKGPPSIGHYSSLGMAIDCPSL